MFLRRMLCLLGLLAAALLAGCGSGGGNDLVGSLVVTASSTDATGGVYRVNASAKYTHPTKDPIGTEIVFTFTERDNTNQILSQVSFSDKVNSSGEIGFFANYVQRATPTFITVSARTGDLVDSEQVTVPALAPLTVNPQAVAFAVTDGIGTTKTITVGGGVTPYVFSKFDTLVIDVAVNGNTITITRLVAGVINENVTVTDRNGTGDSVAFAVTGQ